MTIYRDTHFAQYIAAGSDFEAASIPVTIPSGETMVTVEVSILNDNVVEQVQEEFSVELQLDSTGGEEVIIEGAGEGTVEVIDDDSKYLTPCSHYTKKYVFSGVQITMSIYCTRICGLLMHEINDNTPFFSHLQYELHVENFWIEV